jgi:hypothetical protein
MNKKFILVFIVSLILLAGGFFYWQKMEKGVRGSSEDYIIREDSKGMFIENSRAGLVAKVPEGWGAEIMDVEEGLTLIYSPESEIKKRENKIIIPISKGCLFRATIVYDDINIDELKNDIRTDLILMGATLRDGFQEVVVSDYVGIKNVFESDKIGPGISIYIPTGKNVYGFHSSWSPGNKEECIKEFDNFLETVSIN